MALAWTVTVAPVDGSGSVSIEGQTESSETDDVVILTFNELLDDYRSSLSAIRATRVQTDTNRGRTTQTISDGGKLSLITYAELQMRLGASPILIPRSVYGIITIDNWQHDNARANNMIIRIWKCNYHLERMTGAEESAGL